MSNVEKILNKNKINYNTHCYKYDNYNINFAKEASEKLQVELAKIFKTLIVESEGTFYVAVISSEKQLDLKLLSKILWVKKIKMWEKGEVEKITGYVFWWISPIWQKKKLKTFIDISAKKYETFYISAWNKWIEVELKPDDLANILNAEFVEITKNN